MSMQIAKCLKIKITKTQCVDKNVDNWNSKFSWNSHKLKLILITMVSSTETDPMFYGLVPLPGNIIGEHVYTWVLRYSTRKPNGQE